MYQEDGQAGGRGWDSNLKENHIYDRIKIFEDLYFAVLAKIIISAWTDALRSKLAIFKNKYIYQAYF